MLAGNVRDLRTHGVDALLVYCENHDCLRKGSISLDGYADNVTADSIRRAVYCPSCRDAGRDDRNVDVRPNWPMLAGHGRAR